MNRIRSIAQRQAFVPQFVTCPAGTNSDMPVRGRRFLKANNG